jgi:MFS transporter, SP family, general alpha glucoside:H+ symporter
MQSRTDEWGYKIPFALQWMWPVPIMIGVALAPESPWWLVRKERPDEARKALLRLTVPDRDPDFNPDETISMMRSTNEFEKQLTTGTSYIDCFRGIELRRTEIVCFAWVIQTMCGNAFMGYSTYFYEQAGLATTNAFTMTMVQYALGAIGTTFSWLLMSWFGRRTLYLGGQVVLTALLLIVGFLGFISSSNSSAQWAIGTMMLLYTFTYDATVGPVCYSLVSELSSTRLRSKSIVLARNLFNVAGIVVNILTPRMLNPTAWDWGAKTGLFWAGSCLLCFVWTYFRLPEPKGRTYAELDLLFERKVPARKFKETIADPFVVDAGMTTGFEKGRGQGSVEMVERI